MDSDMNMGDKEEVFVPDYTEDADGGGDPASSGGLQPPAVEEGTETTSSATHKLAAAGSSDDPRGVKRKSEEQQEEQRVGRECVARGPRNALTQTGKRNVAETILENMTRWYEERFGQDGLSCLQACAPLRLQKLHKEPV